MLLALDVGNSQIFGGVYDGEDLKTHFPADLEHPGFIR